MKCWDHVEFNSNYSHVEKSLENYESLAHDHQCVLKPSTLDTFLVTETSAGGNIETCLAGSKCDLGHMAYGSAPSRTYILLGTSLLHEAQTRVPPPPPPWQHSCEFCLLTREKPKHTPCLAYKISSNWSRRYRERMKKEKGGRKRERAMLRPTPVGIRAPWSMWFGSKSRVSSRSICGDVRLAWIWRLNQ